MEHPGPIPFAHRGGAEEWPENTMPAFENAIRLGYRYLETDVHATSDGMLVAFHDDDLARVCDRPGRIHELPWRDVSQAQIAGKFRVPLLTDILSAWPDARINIDVKSDAGIDPLTDILERCRALQRVCIGTFSESRLKKIRRRFGPQLCTALGPRESARLRVESVLGGRNRGSFVGAAAQVPVRFYGVPVISEAFIRRSHAYDIPVHAWTVDSALEIERLLDLGVDGIMTDRPRLLKDLLVSRGQWV